MQSGGAGGVPRAVARPHLQCVRLGFRGLFTLRDTLSGRRNCHRVDALCVWMAHMLNQGRVKHLFLEGSSEDLAARAVSIPAPGLGPRSLETVAFSA